MTHSILRVHSTSLFEKSFRKLPVDIQKLAEKKDKWFRHDAFDSRLHTHKLKGELEGYWFPNVQLPKFNIFSVIIKIKNNWGPPVFVNDFLK